MNVNNEKELLFFCVESVIPVIMETAKNFINSNFIIQKKSHGNFVTNIDKNIEINLKKALGSLLPNASFLGEEFNEDNDIDSEYQWIIDPIDGTTNLIFGMPYTISVALKKSIDNQVILGVVWSPITNELFYGVKGQGSYRIFNDRTERLKTKKFDKNEGIAIFGLPYDRSKIDKILSIAGKFYEMCSDLKRIGPSSLDICRVASGVAKMYFELDLQEWDVAAGLLILQEAGGKMEREDDLMIFHNGDF